MCKKKEFMSNRVVRALVLSSPDHPDKSVLQDYTGDKLNSADEQAVEIHLTDCKVCIGLLVEVTAMGPLPNKEGYALTKLKG